MSAQDNGGPAFPVPYSNEADGPTQMPSTGMSLRDCFAVHALPAVIVQCAHDSMHGMERADYFAGRAYELADAMLKARQA